MTIHAPSESLLGTRIDALSWVSVGARIMHWATHSKSRMVCLCNVHTVITARDDAALRRALARSDMNAPDGAPIAWLMRKRGHPDQERISGPDLMWRTLDDAAQRGLPVFFYGSTTPTLEKLRAALTAAFPSLDIAGMLAPPFRPLSAQEDAAITGTIRKSGAQLVFVGLGCPKQEKWIASHLGRIDAVMLGVGAAFDYHAGTLRRAPLAWQRAGLEWLYRLAMEPGRLMRRYLVTNTRFLLALPAALWRNQGQ